MSYSWPPLLESPLSAPAPHDVYFGRIDAGWNPETRRHLWESRAFGVMFDNVGSVEAADLQEARKRRGHGDKEWWTAAGYTNQYGIEALERMQAAIDRRALVFVDFRGLEGETVMIGRAVGPIRIVPIVETYTKGTRRGETGTSRYKCMGVEEPRFFALDPVLAAMRPQQATFTAWPSAAKRVRAIYECLPLEREVEALTPGQLEALCYEYLRAVDPGLRLLLPVGRTLPDIDIYGIRPSGERVAAQVTHSGSGSSTVRSKAASLARAGGAARRVLFAGRQAIAEARSAVENLLPTVQLVAVEDAFSAIDAATPWFIDAMLAAKS